VGAAAAYAGTHRDRDKQLDYLANIAVDSQI